MAQGLTPLDKEALRYAQTNDFPAMSASVTVAAIARAPHYVEAIISEALMAAPSHRDAIAHASIEAFPGHAAIVTRAAEATTFLPTGRPRSPGEPEMQDQDVPQVAAKAPPTRRWSGEVSLGGAHSTGNTDTTSLNAALSATYTRSSLSSRSKLRFDLQEDSGSRSTQLFVTNNDTRYDIKSRLFVYNFIEYRDDRFSGFDYEVTENPGLGYRLIDRGLLLVSAQAGPAIRFTKEDTTGQTDSEFGIRAAADLSWQISETAEFINETSFTASGERTLTQNVTMLDLAINERLDGRLTFDIRNNSNPPAGRKSTDTVSRASLVYDF